MKVSRNQNAYKLPPTEKPVRFTITGWDDLGFEPNRFDKDKKPRRRVKSIFTYKGEDGEVHEQWAWMTLSLCEAPESTLHKLISALGVEVAPDEELELDDLIGKQVDGVCARYTGLGGKERSKIVRFLPVNRAPQRISKSKSTVNLHGVAVSDADLPEF